MSAHSCVHSCRCGECAAHFAPASYALDLSAAFFSLGTAQPGFVPDSFLNSYPGDTTTAAIELRIEDMWQRRQGGYQLMHNPLIEAAIAAQERVTRNIETCRRTGSHSPQAEDEELCDVCGIWMGEDLTRRL